MAQRRNGRRGELPVGRPRNRPPGLARRLEKAEVRPDDPSGHQAAISGLETVGTGESAPATSATAPEKGTHGRRD